MGLKEDYEALEVLYRRKCAELEEAIHAKSEIRENLDRHIAVVKALSREKAAINTNLFKISTDYNTLRGDINSIGTAKYVTVVETLRKRVAELEQIEIQSDKDGLQTFYFDVNDFYKAALDDIKDGLEAEHVHREFFVSVKYTLERFQNSKKRPNL